MAIRADGIMMKNPIGFQSIVFDENEDSKYKFELKLTGANLQDLSLLLASLHLIEKELVEAINSIEAEYEVRK